MPEPLKPGVDDYQRIKMIADYQFGTGSGEALFNRDVDIVKSRKTGKIRHVYDDQELIATLRASDGVLYWLVKCSSLAQFPPTPQKKGSC